MQHLVSRTAGFLANRRLKGITHWAIRKYIKYYNVKLDDAVITDIKQYNTFNEFFSRHLKDGARPIADGDNILCSPADGKIVQMGNITDCEWHIKGQHYPLDELFTCEKLAKKYENGYSTNIYLSPRDYHRVHMPFDGLLKQAIYIKGKLYSVNPEHKHAKFINKNERLLCEFHNPEIGNFIVMFIGALNVGSINTVWQGCSNNGRGLDITNNAIVIKKGMELGHFKLGSSVLLITEKRMQSAPNVEASQAIKMGMPLLQFDQPHD